jgi:hypothetical protein
MSRRYFSATQSEAPPFHKKMTRGQDRATFRRKPKAGWRKLDAKWTFKPACGQVSVQWLYTA